MAHLDKAAEMQRLRHKIRNDLDHVQIDPDEARKMLDFCRDLSDAVVWVLTDAAFKAPELIGDIPQRWVDRLEEAMADES